MFLYVHDALAVLHLLSCICCDAFTVLSLLCCMCCAACAVLHLLRCVCCVACAVSHLLGCMCVAAFADRLRRYICYHACAVLLHLLCCNCFVAFDMLHSMRCIDFVAVAVPHLLGCVCPVVSDVSLCCVAFSALRLLQYVWSSSTPAFLKGSLKTSDLNFVELEPCEQWNKCYRHSVCKYYAYNTCSHHGLAHSSMLGLWVLLLSVGLDQTQYSNRRAKTVTQPMRHSEHNTAKAAQEMQRNECNTHMYK